MEKKTIGSFIATLRKAQGFTQQEVADRLNVSNKTISKWERDESSPDLGLIPVIAELFNVTCDEILLGKRIVNENNESSLPQKVEKQMTRLAENITTHFRNMALIAVLYSLIGYIALFLCAYAFDLPIPGTGLYVVFFLTGIAALATSLNNSLHRLKTGEDADEKCVADARAGIWQFCFAAVLVMLLTFFFALPLIMARDLHITSLPPDFKYELHVLSWEIYLRYIPAMKLLWLVSAIPVFFLMCKKLRGGKMRMFDSVENGKKLGLIQLALFACVVIFTLLTFHIDSRPYHIMHYITEIITYVCFGSAIAIAAIYIVLKKGNRIMLTAFALRNMLLWIPALSLVIFINNTVSYGFIYPISWISDSGRFLGDNFNFIYVVQHVGLYDLSAGMLLYTSLVIFIYIAVKYKYMSKSKGVS